VAREGRAKSTGAQLAARGGETHRVASHLRTVPLGTSQVAQRGQQPTVPTASAPLAALSQAAAAQCGVPFPQGLECTTAAARAAGALNQPLAPPAAGGGPAPLVARHVCRRASAPANALAVPVPAPGPGPGEAVRVGAACLPAHSCCLLLVVAACQRCCLLLIDLLVVATFLRLGAANLGGVPRDLGVIHNRA
jgi:hypothetical protein